jgi:thiaminase/transcriptional activator TenA
MTGFSDEAWQRTAQLREAIHKLPFNTELAAGTLSRARFQAYIVQDALYLSQYSRALAIAAAKAPDAETLRPSRSRLWKPWWSSKHFMSGT